MKLRPASPWSVLAVKLAGAAAVLIAGSYFLPSGAADQEVGAPASAASAVAPAAAAVGNLAGRTAPARPRFVIDTALEIDRPLRHGDYAWADEPAAPGRLWIHVNLDRQLIRVMRGSAEIGRAVILYGATEKPTPRGIFRITEKDADHVSNIYGVPMPHMLRLTNDGIAIHGANVEYGWGTNGCIGVPREFAALLFAKARLGDEVVITDAV